MTAARSSPAPLPARRDSFTSATLGLCLAVWTLAVYRGVLGNGFAFDDVAFVTGNPHVLDGVNAGGVAWAFTTFHAGNWHPLTWLSHMLDVDLFGLRPAGHHLTSVLLHVANSLLVLRVLRRTTGALWRSAAVAALFAVHPVHVESVAWIAERKDVLSTFFMLLSLGAYQRYVERPAAGRYFAVAGLYLLGLLSKPMLVSFPLVLLLLDGWPLGRWQVAPRGTAGSPWTRLLLEKIPFLALAAVVAVVTLLAQQRTGALGSMPNYPLGARVENALVAYAAYLAKMVWPARLAGIYPYALDLPAWKVGGAASLLAAASFAVARLVRSRPYLATGWLWYLLTLLPVIGLVQVGVQSMADRYTYIPSIGIFLACAWQLPDSAAARASSPAGAVGATTLRGALTAAALLSFSAAAAVQVGYWKDDITLFGRAVEVTGENPLARYNLGSALERQGRVEEALTHLEEAVRISPSFTHVRNNIGHILAQRGDNAGAIRQFSAMLDASPRDATAHFNLGLVLARQGRIDAARFHLLEALGLDPGFPEAHYALGNALLVEGRLDEAAAHFTAALAAERPFPLAAEAHNNLGIVFTSRRQLDEAIEHFQEALRLKPEYAGARDNLLRALQERGR